MHFFHLILITEKKIYALSTSLSKLLFTWLFPSTNRVWNSGECDLFLSSCSWLLLARECCLAAVLGGLEQNKLFKQGSESLTEILL